MGETYTHGHQESVLRSHRWRTVENSAAYLAPRLRPGVDVLDVGCGPGTITLDIARMVHPGRVVGVDNAREPLKIARAQADEGGHSNAEFWVANAYRLSARDGAFDVVHAHQLLQHLSDPVAALGEFRRVCRSGGVVAVRDADYAAMTWYPQSPGLDEWLDLYRKVARANNAEPDAGRRLMSWAHAAGFEDLDCTASVWCFANLSDRRWWGSLWAERTRSASFALQAQEYGLATEKELRAMEQAWHDWMLHDDGWFAVLHGEIICHT